MFIPQVKMAAVLRKYYLVDKKFVQNFRRCISFKSLAVNSQISRRLRRYGITTPSEIQEKAFQPILGNKNVVINSETGSGKTLAYGIPILHKIYENKKLGMVSKPHALVIVPNVELTYQVGEVFRSVLGANVSLVTKELPMRLIDTDVVVSTAPHIMTYPLDVLNDTKIVVIDEADYMIARKVGKHGRKDPLFIMMKHFLNPETVPNTNHPDTLPDTKHHNIQPNTSYDIQEHLNTLNSNSLNYNLEGKEKQYLTSKNITGTNDEVNNDIHSNAKCEIITQAKSNTDNVETDFLPEETTHCNQRQFIFVGATMPEGENKKNKKAMRYIKEWAPDVIKIQSDDAHKIKTTSKMTFFRVEKGNKTKLLLNIFSEALQTCTDNSFRVIIFVNTLEQAEQLYTELTGTKILEKKKESPESKRKPIVVNNKIPNISAETPDEEIPLIRNKNAYENEVPFPHLLGEFKAKFSGHVHLVHKQTPREERLNHLEIFNSLSYSFLIATDVVARGLDFPDVDMVVQYDFSTNVVDVLHRIGRTGRMGRRGKVVHFVTKNDVMVAKLLKEKYDDGSTVEDLFSRNRGLAKKIRRKEMEDVEIPKDDEHIKKEIQESLY